VERGRIPRRQRASPLRKHCTTALDADAAALRDGDPSPTVTVMSESIIPAGMGAAPDGAVEAIGISSARLRYASRFAGTTSGHR
jgi:hypothetical protein